MKKHSRRISAIILGVLLLVTPLSSLADGVIPEEIELWESAEAQALTLRGPQEAVAAGHTCELIASFLSEVALEADVTFWKDGEWFATATLEENAATVEYSTIEVGDHSFHATVETAEGAVQSNSVTVTIAGYGEDDGSSLTLDSAASILDHIPALAGEETAAVDAALPAAEGGDLTEEEILAQAWAITGEDAEYEAYGLFTTTIENFRTDANNNTVTYGEPITVWASVWSPLLGKSDYGHDLVVINKDTRTVVATIKGSVPDGSVYKAEKLYLDAGTYTVAYLNGSSRVPEKGQITVRPASVKGSVKLVNGNNGSLYYGVAPRFEITLTSANTDPATRILPPSGTVTAKLDDYHDISASIDTKNTSYPYTLSLNTILPIAGDSQAKYTAGFTFRSDNGNYLSETIALYVPFQIIPAPTTVTMDVAYNDTAETADITVHVHRASYDNVLPGAPDASGTVYLRFTDGQSLLANPKDLQDGVVVFRDIPLSQIEGKEIDACYNRVETRFEGNTATKLIDRFATTVTIAPFGEYVYGEKVPVKVTVVAHDAQNKAYSPNGTVALLRDGTQIGTAEVRGGVATLTIDGGLVPEKTHSLVAKFTGSHAVRDGQSAETPLRISKATSQTTTAHTDNWSTGYTITATFSYGSKIAEGNRISSITLPTGTATLQVSTDGWSTHKTIATVNIVDGKASFSYKDSLFGAQWRVVYNGDGNYKVSEAIGRTNEVVGSLTLTADKTTLTYPATVALMATVTPTMNEGSSISFYDGGVYFKGNQSRAAVNQVKNVIAPSVGTHTYTVAYQDVNGTGGLYSGQSSVTVTVSKAQPTVTLATSRSTANGSVTLTATVSGVTGGATPTGSVRFTYWNGVQLLSDVPLVNGKATLTVATSQQNLPAEAFNVTATYLSDANYNTAADTKTVAARITPIILNPTPTPSPTANSTKKATATASPAPTAKVTVSGTGSLVSIQDSGVPLAAPAGNGDSTIRLLDEFGKQIETYSSKMLIDSIGVLPVETQVQRTKYTYEIRMDEMRAFGTQYPDGYYDIMADGIAVSLPFALYDGFPGLSDYLRDVKLSRNTLRLRATLEQVDAATPQAALEDTSASANLESPVWRLTLTLHDALGNTLDYSPNDALTVPVDLRFATGEDDAFGLMYNPATQVMALQEAVRREGEAIISAVQNGDYGLVIDKGVG